MSLTQREARARAALLHDVEYDVDLDLREGDTYGSVTAVRFGCREAGASVFLELAGATDVRVRLNGADLPPGACTGGRIELSGLATANVVRVEATMPYVTTGDGMHRFVDPVDGERYVSAYCGMDNAQRVFACFDQPDLRAPVRLRVRCPEHWSVLASGRTHDQGTPGEWEFAATPAIPTYLFVVCAGPWHSARYEHAGRTFGWHARRSLAGALDRDLAGLQELTRGCWDHYTSIFEEPYPFDDYHQVFVPELNWGAQENPGCVTFRDELLPLEPPPAQLVARRAMVVAHEMAHMWFGNLVTMEWFDDAWLSESFADYMGFTVAELVTGSETGVDFVADLLPGAYAADERRSTHPVAPEPDRVVDVDTAYGNFDEISYAKGNAAVRQLVTWLGEAAFLRGVNLYLHRHRLGAARLDDFVAALAEGSGRDVSAWAQAWLRTTGVDTIEVTREAGSVVLSRSGSRPHRLRVTELGAEPRTTYVDLAGEPVRVPATGPVLPNSHGDTYARLRLDASSLATLTGDLSTVPDAVGRAVLWTTVHDLVRTAELAPQDYLGLLAAQLPAEQHRSVVEAVLDRAQRWVVPALVRPAQVPAARDALAAVGLAVLDASPTGPVALAAMRTVVATTHDQELLLGWLRDGRAPGGEPLDQRLRWEAVRRAAETGGPGAPALVEAELVRDPSSGGGLAAATARAAVPDVATKAAAWQVLTGGSTSNRAYAATARGFWSAEQHDLLAPYVGRYLEQSPGLARTRGQAFSRLVGGSFPALALGAEELALLDRALQGDLPTVLRRAWEDRRDDLALAVRSLERYA